MNPLLKQLRDKRAALHTAATSVTEMAATENRDLTDPEQSNFDDIAGQIEALDKRIEPIEKFELRSQEADALSRKVDDGAGTERKTHTVGGGEEPVEYRDGGENSFFMDFLAATEQGDIDARERLGRHSLQMRATTTTSYGNGLVVPQYLVDQFAPVVRESQPFIAALNRIPLPAKGMTLSIPRGTTGTTVATPSAENTAVSETDYVAGILQVPVITVAGAQEISFQALDRGENVDAIIFADLAAAYATEVDRQALVGNGTNTTFTSHEGVLNADGISTATGALIDTWAEWWTGIWGAYATVRNARKLPPTHIVVTADRWAWLSAQNDTTGRPLLSGINPTNAPGSFTGGTLGAFTVIVDPNLADPAGLVDRAIILRLSDVIFAEEPSAPHRIRLDQPKGKQLTSQLVAYGYSAFTAERYPQGVFTWTALPLPTF